MTVDEVFRIDPTAVTWRWVAGEVVALDLKADEYLALDGTGAVLWKHLEDGATVDALVSALEAAFDATGDRSIVERDVVEFLDQLRGRALLAPA